MSAGITRLENGRWVPTFPNARYVFGKTEFDYWTEQNAKAPVRRLETACCDRRSQHGRDRTQRLSDRTITRVSCRHPAIRPAIVAFTFGRAKGRRGVRLRSDALARCRRVIPRCRRSSMSIRRRRRRRGAVFWSAIATPTRCAAPRISPRLRRGKSGGWGTDFPARWLAEF